MCHRDPVEVKKLRVQLADREQRLEECNDEIAQLNGVVESVQEDKYQLEKDLEDTQYEVDRLNMKIDQWTPRAYSQAAALVTTLSWYLTDEVEVCDRPGHRHRLFDVLQDRDYRLGDAIYSVSRALTTGEASWVRAGPGVDLPHKKEHLFPPQGVGEFVQ